MSIFKLPDLGEGLPDAEIHAWFVKPGDVVVADQPLVAMETAKAIVDIPCPHAGVIARVFGQPGDVIKTGAALVEYTASESSPADKGTIVGHIEHTDPIIHLNHLKFSEKKAPIEATAPRLRSASRMQPPSGFEGLHGTRRAMLRTMQLSHPVVPVSIFDDANVSAWITTGDITLRVIRAMLIACEHEPALNAWFDAASSARKCHSNVHLGIAMDNDEGLFVPVIHHINSLTDENLRQLINEYKQAVAERRIAPEQLQGATITLSNFGKFAGRFATPRVCPPMVAILAVGRLYHGIVSIDGVPQSQALLPLSLSFDHRAVTGGEASRFLGYLINALQQP